jgi:hypothetical protein
MCQLARVSWHILSRRGSSKTNCSFVIIRKQGNGQEEDTEQEKAGVFLHGYHTEVKLA